MTAHLISYDLNKPGANYGDLIDRIKSYGTWCKLLDSAWIVVTASSADAVYNHLSPALDKGDHVFVVAISGQDRQGWLPKTVWDWIGKNV